MSEPRKEPMQNKGIRKGTGCGRPKHLTSEAKRISHRERRHDARKALRLDSPETT
jgi:hypothetical protein